MLFVFVFELVDALTKKLDKFLLRLRPKITLASIIGRVPLVSSNSSQFRLTISAIGGSIRIISRVIW